MCFFQIFACKVVSAFVRLCSSSFRWCANCNSEVGCSQTSWQHLSEDSYCVCSFFRSILFLCVSPSAALAVYPSFALLRKSCCCALRFESCALQKNGTPLSLSFPPPLNREPLPKREWALSANLVTLAGYENYGTPCAKTSRDEVYERVAVWRPRPTWAP